MRQRTSYPKPFKAQVVQECLQPGVSMASVDLRRARRKFFELLVANKSPLAEQALHSISGLYEVERHVRDLCDEERWRIRQEKAAPIIKKLHDWMPTQRASAKLQST